MKKFSMCLLLILIISVPLFFVGCQKDNLNASNMSKSTMWRCLKCGYEKPGKEAWKTCPLCQYDQGYCELHLESKQC